ncbi:mechanosensitive ion channel family protein [Hydrogenobacter hydrogenophilus]|uniref:Mechanosensitive ion channel n=1 Tax=Hydrogenobacter hydrogenophilus TaxID=35835 RepID=A0A285P3D4_9AQUI|nr:mechanosensitive ion channel domain-containing protein [Hydrogenobacter hydrogenophilus]SNZ14381.1 Mechanosensitive ion channel [Hydrogenobacter hydrogenophilus]
MKGIYIPTLIFSFSLLLLLGIRFLLLYLIERSAFKSLHRILRIPSVFWVLAVALDITLYFSNMQRKYVFLVEKIIQGVLILSLTFVLADIVVEVIRFYINRAHISLPPTGLIFALVKSIIITLGFITFLSFLDVPVVHFITTLGVGALAVSLALQGTLSNFFSGLNILLSKQIKIGDFVRLESGEEGFVQDITWMNTVIRRLDNNTLVVPNSRLVNSILLNYRSLLITVPITVSYNSDLEKVERETLKVAKEVQKSVKGADQNFEPSVRYQSFGDLGITFHVVLKAIDPTYQSVLKHELVKRIKQVFYEQGIEFIKSGI